MKPLGVDVENKYIRQRLLPEFHLKGGIEPVDYRSLVGKEYIVFTPKGVIPTKGIKPEKVAQIYRLLKERTGLSVVIAVEPKEKEYIKALRGLGLDVFSEDLLKFTFLLKGAKALLSAFTPAG